MKNNPRELRAECHSLLGKMKKLNSRILEEHRNYTDDETELWNHLNSRFQTLKTQLRKVTEEYPGMLESGLLSARDTIKGPDNIETRGNANMDNRKIIHTRQAIERAVANDNFEYNEQGTSARDAYNRYLQYGWSAVDSGAARARQVDSDIMGGFATTPIEVVNRLINGFNNSVFLRQYATVIPLTSAQSLGAPEIATDVGDPTWTTEILTGAEDSDLDFARRNLTPHPIARRIKVSNRWLRLSVLPPEELVRQRLEYVMGTVLEANYLGDGTTYGDGNNKPLGLFVASNSGISSGRDVTTYNTTTQVKADNLIACVGELKAQYRKNARWIMHRSTQEAIRKLKDGEGNYLWRAGLDGMPNTLLGFPVHLSEYAPDYDSLSAGSYICILGDFSWYWVVDSLTVTIKRLDELYAETDQTGFIARYEGDAAPVLEDAFVRSKTAAS